MAGTATLPKKTDRTPTLEHKTVPVSGFKVLDDAQGVVETIVSVTGIVDEVKDRILPGAYEKTLAARTPKGVWSHDWDTPVSKTVSVEEIRPGDPRLPAKQRNGQAWPTEAGGLLVQTQFNLETQRGSEAYSDVKFFGDEQEWSIGYNVPVGGAKIDRKTGVREIAEIELFEYSPVLFGAMPLTVTTDVKTAQAAFAEIEAKDAIKPHDYRGDDGEACQVCGEDANHEMHIGSPKWEAAKEDDESETASAEEPEGEKSAEETEGEEEAKDGETDEEKAVTAGAITEPGISTTSPTGQGIEPQFGGVERGGAVTGGGTADTTMKVVEGHGSCPSDRSYGVTSGGALVACFSTREEAEGLVGASKIAKKSVEEKPFEVEERDGKYCVVNAETGDEKGCHDTRAEAEAQRDALYANDADEEKRKKLESKGVPVATGPEGLDAGELESIYAVGAYSKVCDLVEELDSGLDALQGAIGRGDTDAADAYWTAVMNAADALLDGLGVDDTDAIEGDQRLEGDGWNPECDPGTMAQATDACVDLGYAAWQAGNFAQAAALVFAADCSVDELMDWFGLDDSGLLVVPASYYDEWSATLPEAVKDGKLDERIADLRSYGEKEGRVLSGGNANAVIDAVSKLIEVLNGAGVPHPFQTGTGEEPGTGTNAEEISTDVEIVDGSTDKDSLKTGESVETKDAETAETKDADGPMGLGEYAALVERAKSLRVDL